MTLERAFDELLKTWSELPKEFKDKYRAYKSHYLNGTHEVGLKIKREMLLEVGWHENWTLSKDNAKKGK